MGKPDRQCSRGGGKRETGGRQAGGQQGACFAPLLTLVCGASLYKERCVSLQQKGSVEERTISACS